VNPGHPRYVAPFDFFLFVCLFVFVCLLRCHFLTRYFLQWFSQAEDGSYFYKGGYWEAKEAKAFKNLPDIF